MSNYIDKDSSSIPKKSKRLQIGLAWQIGIGLITGVAIGLILNTHPEFRDAVIRDYLQPAGDLFIRMIKMVVIPIVFTSMVVGIAGVGDGKSFGRIGIKTIIYFEVITTLAIIIGLLFGNLLTPGAGTDISKLGAADMSRVNHIADASGGGHSFMHTLLGLVPDNIVSSMANAQLLPVIFFAVLFGIGLQKTPVELRTPVLGTLKGISDAMFKVTAMVMHYAPVGVAALIAVTVANFGFNSLVPLLKLVGVTYLAIIFFTIVVLGATAKIFGINIFTLLKVIKTELLIAFTTCSSATVLPQIMEKVEKLGTPRSIATFVVPTGYVFNLDGASIYLGIGTLFVAQLYDIHLGLEQQIILVLTMVVTSKGAAGVPGFMFVILLATLTSAGLPIEGLALIAGIDRVMDMGRTALNVVGNALAPLIIAKWEGEHDREMETAYLSKLSSTKISKI
ncbi:MAG: cation:dicarboxylase symporter family transporter [Pantoea sp.]|uniref:cation:dicarboxylate symporter family transporter n=1 Tax=Pantoea sp. TaxID=69393 RepID=UPI0039E43A59